MTDYLPNTPDMVTIPEAAGLLRLTASAIEQLIDEGKVQCCTIAGNRIIPKVSLLGLLASTLDTCYTNSVKTGETSYLDNCSPDSDCMPFSGGDTEMATKINQPVIVNGQKCWIRANTMQEFANKVLEKATGVQASALPAQTPAKHDFADYSWNWFHTYSEPNVETVTKVTYQRQLKLHLIPAFEGMAVEDITTDDVQRLFNGMKGKKATKDKARTVLNQILDAAVEEKLLPSNPLKSKRIRIKGKASQYTPVYSVEQMKFIVRHIPDVKRPEDRAFLAIQAMHPLRPEEALGLCGEDIDRESMTIHVRRAVTHPTRNQPEVKDVKTLGSARDIGLSEMASHYLLECPEGKFLFGGGKPLSYTQVRRMCNRIKEDIGFSENITPSRFRTTVLTDLYDQTKDIKLTQQAAGHTNPTLTMKHYAKGRATCADSAAAVDKAYAS